MGNYNDKPAKDKLDIFRKHLMKGFPLSPARQEKLKMYEEIFILLTSGFSIEMAKKEIMNLHNVSSATARDSVYNSIELFGNPKKFKKEGLKMVIYENYMNIFKLAKEDYERSEANLKPLFLEKMLKAIENSEKVFGLREKNFNMTLNLPKAPEKVYFTSDPQALEEMKKAEMEQAELEYTEYEETGESENDDELE